MTIKMFCRNTLQTNIMIDENGRQIKIISETVTPNRRTV